MDSYLATTYAAKTTMESEISILQQKIDAQHDTLHDSMPVSTFNHDPSTPPPDKPSTPVKSTLPRTPWSTNTNTNSSDPTKPFSKDTAVKVDTGFISIPYAIVDSHRIDTNSELVYDIHTQDNCRFTFASTLVHALPPVRPSPPPKSSTHHQKYKHTSFPSRPHAPMDENSMSSPFQSLYGGTFQF